MKSEKRLGRGRRPDDPRMLGLQIAHPSVIFFDCRGDHRSSEVIWVTAAHPSIAQKRDLQKPSLVREGGPLAVDE